MSAYVLYDNSSYNSQSFQLALQYDLSGSPQYPAISTQTAYNRSWTELSGEFTIPSDAENISFYVQTAYTTNVTEQDKMNIEMAKLQQNGVKIDNEAMIKQQELAIKEAESSMNRQEQANDAYIQGVTDTLNGEV